MPRIIYIITGLSTGGAEMALYNLLNGGIAERFNCLVISLADEGAMGEKIEALGVPVATLGMRNGLPSLGGLKTLYTLVREFEPDVIQGWMYHGNLIASLARRMASGSPSLVWNIRQSLYELKNEKFLTRQVIRLNRFFSTEVDALLYNSQLSKKQHEAFGFSATESRVVPNGIDVQKYLLSSSHRKKIRSELGVLDDAVIVGHVARYHPMKDHQLFIKAAVKIAKRNAGIYFLLSGRNVLLENADIERLVPATLSNRFFFLGERNDVSELMCAMDVLCLSSAWGEGFPNVIGEAMATGLPCVATNVGDSEIIIGDTGVTVPACSEDELISGIEMLAMMTHQERESLGEEARARIEDNYKLSEIVSRYTLLYKKLINIKEKL